MNRRSFLTMFGVGAGSAALGAGATGGYEEWQLRTTVSQSGHAVGAARPAGLTGTTITYRADTNRKIAALTFDDGPSAEYTAKVLDALESHDAVATFFMIGRHVESLPNLARRVSERHEIGNHTYSHPDLSLASAEVAKEQLHRTHDLITKTIGREPTLFRPPYGRFSGATAMIATSLNYPIVLWDNKFDANSSASANARAVHSSTKPGSIVLGHDARPLDCSPVVGALPDLISALRDDGFAFVTVSDLLKLEPAATL